MISSSLTSLGFERLNWTQIGNQLDLEGFAVLPDLLNLTQVRDLTRAWGNTPTGRASEHASLEASDLGCGELLYFNANLPPILRQWRASFYQHLSSIANRWNDSLGLDRRFPSELEGFLGLNREAGQIVQQTHLSRLRAGDYLKLHQRNRGKHVFPLQVIALLSEPEIDFQGGEFVLTEQRPRMQSRPAVVPLRRGDAAIIATANRPFKGAKGHYRVNTKHAVSQIRKGERIGLELSFHDA
jgi:uncharacterized protein